MLGIQFLKLGIALLTLDVLKRDQSIQCDPLVGLTRFAKIKRGAAYSLIQRSTAIR